MVEKVDCDFYENIRTVISKFINKIILLRWILYLCSGRQRDYQVESHVKFTFYIVYLRYSRLI